MPYIRVCAITCDLYPDDPLVRRIAEAAVGPECEYHVICPIDAGQPAYELFNEVHVHRIRIADIHGRPVGRISGKSFRQALLLWSLFTMGALAKVAELHIRRKFDVVHVHNVPDYLVFAGLIPKLLGARTILHVQDVTPELMAAKSRGIFRAISVPLAKLQERVSTSFADHVLTVGWPFEEKLLERGVRKEKLSSVLNSADPNIFCVQKRTPPFVGQPTSDRPLVIMYHGTCAVRNGVDIAVEAFAEALTRAPHLRLALRITGDFVPQIIDLVSALRLQNQVSIFPARGPMEEVADFIAAGDVGIIPYRSDGFMDMVLPTKAYEFALMRRPMIASDTRAMRSMFAPESVMWCEPSCPTSFADAIVELYHSPKRRAELVAAAEQDYAPYHWEIVAQQYRDLLGALGHNPKRRDNFDEVQGSTSRSRRKHQEITHPLVGRAPFKAHDSDRVGDADDRRTCKDLAN
jgi:glycosyltransferase involved in cell wall biosynthesis